MDSEKQKSVRYIEIGDDKSLFVFSEDESTVKWLKRRSIRFKTLYIPQGVNAVGYFAFREINVRNVVLPDGVEIIRKGAFKDCKQLRRIYIPASVKVIENEVFLGCHKTLEIYCGGEPQEGWLDGETVEKEHWDDMTDAFNFHRSGGSFDDKYLVKRVEIIYNSYNPDKHPVHSHFTREQFDELLKEV